VASALQGEIGYCSAHTLAGVVSDMCSGDGGQGRDRRHIEGNDAEVRHGNRTDIGTKRTPH